MKLLSFVRLGSFRLAVTLKVKFYPIRLESFTSKSIYVVEIKALTEGIVTEDVYVNYRE